MSTWFCKNLGDAMLAGDDLQRVEDALKSEFGEAARSSEVAVFMRHESEGRLHCEVMLYFSPASAAVAVALGATACPRPSPDGLGLLVGNPVCWSALFPSAVE